MFTKSRPQSELKDIIKNYKATDIMSRHSITGVSLPQHQRKKSSARSSRVQTPKLNNSDRSRYPGSVKGSSVSNVIK